MFQYFPTLTFLCFFVLRTTKIKIYPTVHFFFYLYYYVFFFLKNECSKYIKSLKKYLACNDSIYIY